MDKLDIIRSAVVRETVREQRGQKIDPKTFRPQAAPAKEDNLPAGVNAFISPTGHKVLKGNIFGPKTDGPVKADVTYGVRPGSDHDGFLTNLAIQSAKFDAENPNK